MLIRKGSEIPSSEITDEQAYHSRRDFIRAGALALGAGVASTVLGAEQPLSANEKPTPYEAITTYNNYYEFGLDKSDPARNATKFRPKPWTVKVTGLVKKPKDYALDDLLAGITVEDRTYRMRCVEGWSMVIPWQGVPLASLIKKLEPLPSAKFIEMKTLFDLNQMPMQREGALPWPYVEGLRLDEATNPLTLFATGIYGKPIPNQNGAPLRLVTPWKYGFKGVKAIVSIHFTDKQPKNTWQVANPVEYGFYANVNPNVDHPRWSQKKEKIIGQKLTLLQIAKGESATKPTLMFNGYADQVASMYAGMDLKKNF